jgi:hypothetical protein
MSEEIHLKTSSFYACTARPRCATRRKVSLVGPLLRVAVISMAYEFRSLILSAHCRRVIADSPFFIADDFEELSLFGLTKSELEGSLRETEETESQIRRFNPVDGEKRLLPGLSEKLLPAKQVKAISREVQQLLFKRLQTRRNVVLSLVGDAGQCAEAESLLKSVLPADLMSKLKERRNQLSK